ncbi:MAG: PEP-CTERM sorting domain-containing protein [Chthonomonas sp.]|nr:PEP-CTERM sorting domain-containing protein [Chthonomonas sp.]
MKKLILTAASAALAMGSAFAVNYSDSTTDVVGTFAGFSHLNIASMDVTNDLSSITFKFNLVGNIQSTDWGKYCVFIDRASGGTTNSNGWARPIGMAAGAESWLGSWVNSGGGFEAYNFGGSWGLAGATYLSTPGMTQSISANSVSLKLNLATIGLTPGMTICFDGITTAGGGGDGAVDSLSNSGPQIGNWPDYSQVGCQTYKLVPEPASYAVMALGLAGILLRRKKG